MRLRGLFRGRLRAAALLGAILLALPLIPPRAYPCDTNRIDSSSLTPLTARVVLATDGSWQEAFGPDADRAARQLIADVNLLLEPTGVHFSIDEETAWSSHTTDASMPAMLKRLEASVPGEPGEIVVGLTGRQLSPVDGIAHLGHVHVVARHHPGRPWLNAPVVAHEIGHLLGAGHHDCDHDYQCLMGAKGIELPVRLCGHHLIQMRLGAEAFLAA